MGCPYETTNEIVFVGTDFDEAAATGESKTNDMQSKNIAFESYWMEVWENGKQIEYIEP